MADWIFDGINKIIKEPNAGSGNITYDVDKDIYSAWKRWSQSGNLQYDPAFAVEGGSPIGSTGLFTGATFLLINGWKLMAGDWSHISFINGNLFSDDGIDSVPNPNFSASLKTFGTTAAQGISTGSGITEQDKIDIAERVWSKQLP